MPSLGPTEFIIIAIVIFALFGYRKLPDAARSIGRSMRIFKAETKGMREDNVDAKAEAEVVRGPLESGKKDASTKPTAERTEAPAPASKPTESD